MKRNRISQFAGCLFAVGYGYLVGNLAVMIPLFSDSAAHGQVVRQTVLPFNVPDGFPFILASPSSLYPLGYPHFYYWLAAIAFSVLREDGFRLLGPMMAAASLFGILFLNGKISGWRVGLLSEVLLGSSLVFFRITVRPLIESVLLSFSIWAIITLVLAVRNNSSRWFATSVVLLSAVAATKQTGYVLLLAVASWVLLSKDVRGKLLALMKRSFIFAICAFLGIVILLIFYVPSVGKSTAYLTWFIYVPRGINLHYPANLQITNVAVHWTIANQLSFFNVFVFSTPFFTGDALLLLVLFVILLGVLFARLDEPARKLLVLFGAFNVIALLMGRNSSVYALHNYLIAFQVVLITFFSAGIYWLKDRVSSINLRQPKLSVVLGLTLIAMVSVPVVLNSYSTGGLAVQYANANMDTEKIVGQWLAQNTLAGEILLAARTNEVGYYSSRTTIWFNDFDASFVRDAWNSNPVTAHELLVRNNVSLIWMDYVINRDPAYYFVEPNGIADWIDLSAGFVKLFQYEDVSIYRVIGEKIQDIQSVKYASNIFGDLDDTSSLRSIYFEPADNLKVISGAIIPVTATPVYLHIEFPSQRARLFLFLRDPSRSNYTIEHQFGNWSTRNALPHGDEKAPMGVATTVFSPPAVVQITSVPGQEFYGAVVLAQHERNTNWLFPLLREKHALQVSLSEEGRILSPSPPQRGLISGTYYITYSIALEAALDIAAIAPIIIEALTLPTFQRSVEADDE